MTTSSYLYIHMTIVLVFVALMTSIFVYGIGLFMRGRWPNLDVRMGVFYFLISMIWLGTGLLIVN